MALVGLRNDADAWVQPSELAGFVNPTVAWCPRLQGVCSAALFAMRVEHLNFCWSMA